MNQKVKDYITHCKYLFFCHPEWCEDRKVCYLYDDNPLEFSYEEAIDWLKDSYGMRLNTPNAMNRAFRKAKEEMGYLDRWTNAQREFGFVKDSELDDETKKRVIRYSVGWIAEETEILPALGL